MRIWFYLILIACVFTAFGGIVGFGIYLVGGFVLYMHFLNKGLLFIQSYLYLKILWETSSPNTANYVATNLGVFESGRYIAESTRYAEKMFNGMQLPVIAQAKELGFGHPENIPK